jgi:hypothetical protein
MYASACLPSSLMLVDWHNTIADYIDAVILNLYTNDSDTDPMLTLM